jgi:hypothetical protein
MTTATSEIKGRIELLKRQRKEAQEDAARYTEASTKAANDAEAITRLINEYAALI